jgi:hypothetical protein
MKRVQLAGLVLAGVAAIAPALYASGQPVAIQERARGAAKIVVATVAATNARYERNEFGDELIVTHAQLAVEEAIKGSGEDVTLALEGGTVDGITLRVSDLPALAKGERAVFFLKAGRNGEAEPHLRGQGILKLDDRNRVRGSELTLDDVRRMARPESR